MHHTLSLRNVVARDGAVFIGFEDRDPLWLVPPHLLDQYIGAGKTGRRLGLREILRDSPDVIWRLEQSAEP